MSRPLTVLTTIKLHDGSTWVIPAMLSEEAIKFLKEYTSVFDEPPVEYDDGSTLVDEDEEFPWEDI